MQNIDHKTVQGFGFEWERFDHSTPGAMDIEACFKQYFEIFPWQRLPDRAVGFDLGCGSGRWAKLVAPRVGKLICVDASAEALSVAERNLKTQPNCEFINASVDEMPISDGSMDFGYSLGVLHHVPDTFAGLRACVAKLKPGAPFLVYLYYNFDNRPLWFRLVWSLSNLIRIAVSRLPHRLRYIVSQLIALLIYLPLAKISWMLARLGLNVDQVPLSSYRDRSFYCMRTDALDRFGTRLEQRFSRLQILDMMERAGLTDIKFNSDIPFWCAVGYKSKADTGSPSKRIVIVVNRDSFFLSHRLPFAKALLDKGMRVTIVAEDTGYSEVIRSHGLDFVSLPISRGGRNPFQELRTIWFLIRLYRSLKPDLVHHVTPKPLFYGTFAARFVNVPVVNAVVGLGSSFIIGSNSPTQWLVRTAYKHTLNFKRSWSIFMNKDDLSELRTQGILYPGANQVIVRGSGVDCNRFIPGTEPEGPPIVLFPARLLGDKGIMEFLAAARAVKNSRRDTVRFVVVGEPDLANPSSVKSAEIDAWKAEGIVEFWGHCADMPEIMKQASIVVLPTYGEGLPKALIEAAASGKPIVATDVNGCRECVIDGFNGLLVPVKQVAPLAEAITRLLDSAELRAKFGLAGRQMIENEFAQEIVIEKIMALYSRILVN